ncbi:hypothetical protein JNC05_23405 [Paraburkholderia ginsengiterrae]|nr:hypothetical protein [Paraburkholderia ginsengiterrae]
MRTRREHGVPGGFFYGFRVARRAAGVALANRAHTSCYHEDAGTNRHSTEMAMFDVIPYWMWAASLLVLALVCGAALNPREPHERREPRLGRSRQVSVLRSKWPMR